MIELKNISAGYGKQPVLSHISVSFEKGRLTSVIGINGSGKSTLLKTVLGILPVTGGEITVDGRNLDSLSRNETARKIAYLPQGKHTPDMTVGQLVLHGRFPYLSYPRRYGEKDRRTAVLAMEQVGIAGLAQKPLHTLSGGMRQNAYIAMALAQDTDYILLDEPTTYLDIAHQLDLMRTLRKLSDEGKGIVTVMHDLPMAFTFSDRIILLDQGGIICDDTPEQVSKQNAIASLFGVAVEKSADDQCYTYRLFKE